MYHQFPLKCRITQHATDRDLIFSLPVGMHTEPHRLEESRTVVQKLSFGLQTLKLYLVIVPHLIRGDGEGVMGRRSI